VSQLSVDDCSLSIGVAYEADPRAALDHPVRRPLGLDALVGQLPESAVEVVDADRDVPP
jgi:hypothetical protein